MLNLTEEKIHWEVVDGGLRVPLIDGKWLCSRRDPLGEARRWLDKYSGDLSDYTVVVVVGLGAGLHILELALAFPEKEILVFEKDLALIKAFKFPIERHKNINIVHFRSVTECFEQPYFEIICQSKAPIFAFQPATQHWKDEAQLLYKALLGQTSQALARRLKTSGVMGEVEEVERLLGTEPLQLGSVIEGLSQTENESSAYWGILKELIR